MLLQERFLWIPFSSGECRSRYQGLAYRSLIPKLPHYRPVGLSRGSRGGKCTKDRRHRRQLRLLGENLAFSERAFSGLGDWSYGENIGIMAPRVFTADE